MIDSIKSTDDYDKIRKVHEEIEKAKNLSFESKNFFISSLKSRIKNLQLKEENQREERERNFKKQEQERKEKRAAFDKAKKRYQSVGTFWKITHLNKNPNRIDYQSMSVEQINNLYGKKR